jgi:hypothetical protein
MCVDLLQRYISNEQKNQMYMKSLNYQFMNHHSGKTNQDIDRSTFCMITGVLQVPRFYDLLCFKNITEEVLLFLRRQYVDWGK